MTRFPSKGSPLDQDIVGWDAEGRVGEALGQDGTVSKEGRTAGDVVGRWIPEFKRIA